ncbi:chemotaxis protein CheW [Gloeocapsa sp. PCC 73106]|uniref:chemotaxis protein CheW n=1 Tax=Gloeocapsa sp. PCC 73106 TaxID=102232 RepID=UPI0002AC3D2B|nr:chemotaxis protein CheW [Gloeocapsa sp. PCC 73106]ELR96848.1 chemotaxis signal transduction protein [Gloeocapsa sp. PCC 73106]
MNHDTKHLTGKETYLHLQINQSTQVILPMTETQEVVVIGINKLTPIPNMPAFVLGLLNQRSQVVWVIDLAAMFNFTPLNLEQPNCNIAIIRIGKKTLGLAVEEIKGIMQIQTESIQSPVGVVSSTLIPYLRGCLFKPPQALFLVLDPQGFLSGQLAENINN